ncbi:MAG: class I SAM-dependent methyltransferase [Bacteroidales bacterium]|jgi:2-polyprenyl-3-methyl-5-hydroxy-6-metoxy-1,4-benzoquinol methylase|nr:class I SAM-dependent methyltransferase [Bacteroidales bacterium]
MEQDIITGNSFDKYNSKNPIYKRLMRGFFKSLIELTSDISSGEEFKILEAGCGEGHLASILLNEFKQIDYTGFDIDSDLIREAQNQLPAAKFHVDSIYEPNRYLNSSFRLCLASEVLEHLEYPEAAIKVIKNLSCDYYLFSVPREPIWRILNMLRLKYLGKRGNTPGHLQHWSKKSFIKTISNDFNILEIRSPFPWTMILCKKANA